MLKIDQLYDIFRKRFFIPNLIISIGILFFIGKLFLIWFGQDKEVRIKLEDVSLPEENSFLLKYGDILLSDFEIIPKNNLFRTSRSEWHPPPPPSAPPPSSPPTPPPPPIPPPDITISGVIGGGELANRAILGGQYFTQSDSEKRDIKKKGYKLYESIGQYQIEKIDNDKVVLSGPVGKSFEFSMKKYKIKRKELLNKPNQLKGESLIGTAIKKWEPPIEPKRSSSKRYSGPHSQSELSLQSSEKNFSSHISGALTQIPMKNIGPRQHISGR